LFGSFENSQNVNDRLYFIGDWVDEYCDLTLNKFLTDYQQKTSMSETEILKVVNDAPQNIQELKEKINRLHFDRNVGKYVELGVINNTTVETTSTTDGSLWSICKTLKSIGKRILHIIK
jgi:hypothetical protein